MSDTELKEKTTISTQTNLALPPSCLRDFNHLWNGNSAVDKGFQACLSVSPNLESLSRDLSNLLEREILPDVKLKCGESTVSAHRSILSARSEVFAAMFRNKMAESETGVVDVTDLEPHVLDMLLKYLYSGKVEDISDDTASGLYAAGDKYAVQSLKMACSEWMVGNMNTENCLAFFILADMYSDGSFKDAVVEFVCDNLKAMNGELWSKFNKEHSELSVVVYQKRFAEMLPQQDLRQGE